MVCNSLLASHPPFRCWFYYILKLSIKQAQIRNSSMNANHFRSGNLLDFQNFVAYQAHQPKVLQPGVFHPRPPWSTHLSALWCRALLEHLELSSTVLPWNTTRSTGAIAGLSLGLCARANNWEVSNAQITIHGYACWIRGNIRTIISKYITICKEIEHDRTIVPLFQELYANKIRNLHWWQWPWMANGSTQTSDSFPRGLSSYP